MDNKTYEQERDAIALNHYVEFQKRDEEAAALGHITFQKRFSSFCFGYDAGHARAQVRIDELIKENERIYQCNLNEAANLFDAKTKISELEAENKSITEKWANKRDELKDLQSKLDAANAEIEKLKEINSTYDDTLVHRLQIELQNAIPLADIKPLLEAMQKTTDNGDYGQDSGDGTCYLHEALQAFQDKYKGRL